MSEQAWKERCFWCMEPIEAPDAVCPHCGWDNHNRVNGERRLEQTVLKGQYLVGRTLGRGGFGITYIGFDLFLHRRIAIKEFFPAAQVYRSDDTVTVRPFSESREEFEKGKKGAFAEAQTIANLEHIPNIVQVYNTFEENETVYIVMEYVDGTTLAKLVGAQGRMGWQQALEILKPIMRSLSIIHENGYIHRDVSPDNIMINRKSGNPILLDFGAARTEQNGVTMTHRPGFSPPEQYRSNQKQDGRGDEYALCATMYYLVTGEVPEEADVRQYAGAPLKTPSELGCRMPGAVEKVMLKGMSLKSADRYPSMEALLAAFEKAEPVPGPNPIVLPVIIGIVLLGGTAAFLLHNRGKEPMPTSIPTATPAVTSMAMPIEASSPSPTEKPESTADSTPATAPEVTAASSPTATPKPTDTPSPTATLKPTDTPSPTATPKPTATQTPTATPEPTSTPTPVPTTAPVIAVVSEPVITLQRSGVTGEHTISYEKNGNINEIEFDETLAWGEIRIGWKAEGKVAAYYVEITDELNGEKIYSKENSQTSEIFNWRFQPGEEGNPDNEVYMGVGSYRIRAGAIPENGTLEDAVWTEEGFGVWPYLPDPVVTETPAPSQITAPEIILQRKSKTEEPMFVTSQGDQIKEGEFDEAGLESGEIRISWTADGDVEEYSVEIVAEKTGDTLYSKTGPQTMAEFLPGEYSTGTQYRIKVGAVPKSGTENDTVWTEEKFLLLGKSNGNAGGEENKSAVEPTAAPTPVTAATIGEVTAAEIVLQRRSSKGEPAIVIKKDGMISEGENDSTGLVGGDIRVNWHADGEVERYIVEILNEKTGDTIYSKEGEDTSVVLSWGDYTPGIQYTIRVGVIPKNGSETDAVWTEEKFIMLGEAKFPGIG